MLTQRKRDTCTGWLKGSGVAAPEAYGRQGGLHMVWSNPKNVLAPRNFCWISQGDILWNFSKFSYFAKHYFSNLTIAPRWTQLFNKNNSTPLDQHKPHTRLTLLYALPYTYSQHRCVSSSSEPTNSAPSPSPLSYTDPPATTQQYIPY